MPTIVRTSGFGIPSEAEQGKILISLPDEQIMWFAMARRMARQVVERAEQAGLEAYIFLDMNRKVVGVEIDPESTSKQETIISVAFDDKPQGFFVEEVSPKGAIEYIGDSESIDQALSMAKPGISLPKPPPMDNEA